MNRPLLPGKLPDFEITPAMRHVLAYCVVSGFGYGLWMTRSLVASSFFAVWGVVFAFVLVGFSKIPNGPPFSKLPRVVKNALSVVIVVVPAFYVMQGVLNREWVYAALVAWWFLVPLVYLFWRERVSRARDEQPGRETTQLPAWMGAKRSDAP